MLKRRGQRSSGQSTVEYAVLIVIIIGVFLAMQQYVKRGFQGRLHSAADDLGDQYDPRLVNSIVTYNVVSNSDSKVKVAPGTSEGFAGSYTTREDNSHTIETRTGTTSIGSYDENGLPK
jgi:hypothetical protein